MSEVALEIDGVVKRFGKPASLLQKWRRQEPRQLTAVRGVSFTLRKGEVLGLVGESGCGKSTLARMVAGLMPPSAGRIAFSADMRTRQMIFQDPHSSLNPRWTVGDIIAEPIRVNKLRPNNAVAARVAELLVQVGLPPEGASRYPQDFSGGQRQRISIARALAAEPDFLILDEPTSALDVSVQAQILVLLKKLQADLGLTSLFITHNLPVLRFMADRIGVMYMGELLEIGPAEDIFERPAHPYTAKLIAAVPDLDPIDRRLFPIIGELPDPSQPRQGCAFRGRCGKAQDICASTTPKLTPAGPGLCACFFPEPGMVKAAG